MTNFFPFQFWFEKVFPDFGHKLGAQQVGIISNRVERAARGNNVAVVWIYHRSGNLNDSLFRHA
ncbi:MAG: hypothetical protein HYY45_18480 [Deltaproteobacteria bacterium]|nr:hypothetical protein [Deltaproteobacteria bacterium]